MILKKGITKFVVLFSIMVALIFPGFSVFAKTGLLTQPTDMSNAIEVELKDDYFNPNVITLPVGKTTTFILKNKGSKPHTFTVKKLGIDTEIQPGKEKTITVKPANPGTYELICKYHVQDGMAGKIIVQ